MVALPQHLAPLSLRLPPHAGIAIGPILFVIALLAILATAIGSAVGSFSGSTTREADDAAGNALIGYAETVRAGVQRVIANGTPWQNVSFGTEGRPIDRMDGSTGLNIVANPNCLSNACKVFHPEGGGILYRQFKEYAPDRETMIANGHASTAMWGGYSWFYLMTVAGNGSGAYPNLVMRLSLLRPGICTAITAKLGNAANVTITGSAAIFANTSSGTCSACDDASYQMTTATLKNKMIFTDPGAYHCHLYAVLHVR